jgi:hypothetical protein
MAGGFELAEIDVAGVIAEPYLVHHRVGGYPARAS